MTAICVKLNHVWNYSHTFIKYSPFITINDEWPQQYWLKISQKKANIIIMQRINCLWSSLILFRLLLYLENIDMLKRQIELIRWKKTEVIYWFGKTIDKIRSIHLIKIKIMLKSILLVKWWSILLGKWSLIIGQMCLLRIKNGYCSSQITIQIYKSTHYNFSESIEGPKIVIK